MTTFDTVTFEEITVHSRFFRGLRDLRATAFGREAAGRSDEIDNYSLHFIARAGEDVLGGLRVTVRAHGPLECEKHYPSWLLHEFGDRMCAASRLCVHPDLAGKSPIPFELICRGWSGALQHGVRIDVSKVRLSTVPYYLKLGYYFIKDSVFEFDRWEARCGLVALPARPDSPSKLSGVFAGIDRPCNLEQSPNSAMFCRTYREFVAATRPITTGEIHESNPD